MAIFSTLILYWKLTLKNKQRDYCFMASESRVKKTLLNARVNLIFYFLTLALSFFSRKIFLNTLGADFVGLTGTLMNLLSFLNLAELGISTAIGYVLYKPLFEQNHHKINEIISVFGYLYRCVGKIILIVGCILSLFLPLIFPSTGFDLSIIYFAYYSFLCSSLIGYFINYRQTLLGADQKNYVVTAYFQTGNIIKTLIQMISAHYTGSYYIWISIEFVFGIIYSFFLNWKINQVYPWLKSDVNNGKLLYQKYPEVMKYTKQLFIHKIAALVQFQTTPFLVYAFVSLQAVAFYGNYTIITVKIKQLFENFLGSTAAGIGNLIAEGNRVKILKIYWEMMTIRFLIVSVATFTLYYTLPLFISLWLGPEYLLSDIVLILVLMIFALDILRGTTDQFINGHGLFYDIWAPAVEAIIYIVVALIGGYLWQLEGVLWGNIVSLLIIVYGWKPYFLFNKGLKIPIWKYWLGVLKLLLLSMISIIILELFNGFIEWNMDNMDWYKFMLYTIYIGFSLTIMQFVLYYVFTNSMKSLVSRIVHFIL